jgi:hypothetical protein
MRYRGGFAMPTALRLALVFTQLFTWIVVTAGSLLVGPASAQDAAPTRSRAYDAAISQGVAAYQAGRYPQAYEQFRQAHLLDPNARTLRGLGIVEHKLGHYARATQFLERALSEERNPLTEIQRADATQLVRDMRAMVGRYQLKRRPADAMISIDGREVEVVAGKPLVLDAGPHKITVSAPGYASRTRMLQVEGHADAELRFVLVPVALSAGKQALSAGKQVMPATTTSEPSVPSPAARQAERPWQRTLAWVAAAGAGVALTSATVAWRLRESAADRWNSDTCLGYDRPRSAICPDDRDQAAGAERWVAIGLTSGTVLAIASALLFATAPDEIETRDVTTRCASGPGDLGLACRLRF